MLNPLEKYSYQERFIAFLDIIGFSDIIQRSKLPDPEISIKQIVSALDVPGPIEEGKLIIGNVGDISKSDHKLTQFSDSIIISTEFSKAGLLNLINHIDKIAFSFLKLGFLCRGGIAQGMLYHENNNAFGPAMLEAYDLEHDKAIYPRVILSEEVEHFIHEMDAGEGTVIKRMIIKYQERYMVHVLGKFAFHLNLPGKAGAPEVLYLTIKQHLLAEIERLKCRTIDREKVVWFHKYFKDTVHPDGLRIMQILS